MRVKVKSGYAFLIALLVVPILFILAQLLIFSYLIPKSKQKPGPSPTTQATPVAQTTKPSLTPGASREPNGSAETANWKTYTNSNLGFSFKYPLTWMITEVNPIIYLRNQNFESKESKAKPRYSIDSGYPQDYINVQISQITDEYVEPYDFKSAIDWFNYFKARKNTTNIGVDDLDLSTMSEISVGDHTAVVVKSTFDEIIASVFVPIGKRVFRINISPYEKYSDPTVNKILSTFQFLK